MEAEGRGGYGFLIAMFRRQSDPYAGGDLASASKVVVGLLGLSTLLCAGFLPLEPVDGRLGAAGWIAAGALVAAGAAGVVLLARRDVGWSALLAVCYAVVAGLALLNWLSGSYHSAYGDLFVIWAGAAAVHPPRRGLPVVLAAAAAGWVPYLVDGGSSAAAGRLGAQSVLIIVVGFVLAAALFNIRRQRLGAEASGKLARMDALTGLGNRLAFDETLSVEIARARRHEAPLSVGIADLDDLKGINDRDGHLEGDRCLSEAARAIELSVRMTDRCFRWGGDEFVIVLPNADRTTAEEVLRRMAHTVRRVCETRDGRPVTLTFGMAEYQDGMNIDDLMTLADLTLLGNKPARRDAS
ncbi:MAG TPA: GGDEF domain-containing protein [Thermoleophilaceae bacterium]|nr:GGDEF domain-containing protein [Thermoleophilaceae bacterium]